MSKTETNNMYGASAIRVLKGLEPVKQRPGMYTLTDSPLHIIQEVIDNASDEVLAGFGSKIEVILHADNSVSVSDNGRGIPTGIHPEEKVPVLELVFTRLHAGGKFSKSDGAGPYSFAGGLHGVGVAVTNALSTRLEVTICREGQKTTVAFKDGFVDGEILTQPLPTGEKRKTGTTIRAYPDPKYFDTALIPEEMMVRLLRSKAVLLPGSEVTFRNEKTNLENTWKYSGGLREYLLSELKADPYIEPFEAQGFADDFTESFTKGEGASWVVVWTSEGQVQSESYVNLIPTSLGGTHEAGLKDGLYQAMKAFMEAHGLQSKGVKVLADDVMSRANFVLSTKALDPQFQGQTKEKLTSRETLRLVSNFVRPQFEFWLNDHFEQGKKLAELIIRQAQARQRQNNKYEKKKSSTVAVLPGKLTDCETDDISRNELFIVEGDSAGGSAKAGRDKEFQAILPLRGKILNTWEVDPDRLFASGTIHDVAVAIGVDPHTSDKPDDLKGLRYGKICILSDADVDGSHIQVLLLTLFYRHFPKLIEAGHVYVAMPPLFRVKVPKLGRSAEKTYYCLDERELKITTNKLIKSGVNEKHIEVSRFKGLGEMTDEQLAETTLNPDTRHLLPIGMGEVTEEMTKSIMNLLMAKNESNGRRQWMEVYGDSVSVDV